MAHKNHNQPEHNGNHPARRAIQQPGSQDLTLPEKMLISWFRSLEEDSRIAVEHWAKTRDPFLMVIQAQRDPVFRDQLEQLFEICRDNF